jgi:hypothetical protein
MIEMRMNFLVYLFFDFYKLYFIVIRDDNHD